MLNNNKGYSILIAIIIIGFLFVLTSAIFKLVLVELNDNRGRGDYLKAYYGAEGAGEYAMLKIKSNGYAYYNKLDIDKSKGESTMLSLDGTYKGGRDVLISYDINSKVKTYEGNLGLLSYDIIPLFYTDDTGSGGLVDMSLILTSGNPGDISWNIISASGGLSGVGGFSNSTTIGILKELDESLNFSVEEKSISWFLNQNKNNFNYLVLFNSSDTTPINYVLDGKGNFFTKPRTEISVSGKIGDYKQNLSIKYDNTEYLGILKYSIYSN
nr:hypothetical protein [Candidatus Gracilibacteria bacterium]